MKKPELLSPAGGWQQLKAAIDNGADAVYMGGTLFNARIKAANFGENELQEAIDYAHERNVRVYVTCNTLIADEELEEAFEYASFIYRAGADAIIVQDIGLANLIHKYLPDFAMHLSTQGTVYNVHAIEAVKRLGFKRVVPARELSIQEIEQVCRRAHKKDEDRLDGNNLEVEVFVHGALCMCYSGQCQMSRLIAGNTDKNDKEKGKSLIGSSRSGNRGLCAQPCRLPYTNDKGETSYWLSPKDICTIERIPELVRAGVDSFKIEGRLKSAEYVATVTRIYRKYIDLYYESHEKEGTATKATRSETEFKTNPEDMWELMQIFNRGSFTCGYLEGNPGRQILSGNSPKNRGLYVGKVTRVSREIKGKKKQLLDVKITHKNHTYRKGETHEVIPNIKMGDGIEIRGKNKDYFAELFVTDNIVTYLKQISKEIIRIGDFEIGVHEGDEVYKVTDKALNGKAHSAMPKKVKINMLFTAAIGRKPALEICEDTEDGKNSICRVEGDFVTERALKKPMQAERISEQLAKLGDTPFVADKVLVEIEDRIMIPISTLNKMRRDAVRELLQAKHVRRNVPSYTDKKAVADIKETRKRYIENSDKFKAFGSLEPPEYKQIVPLESFVLAPSPEEVPYILNVSKGALDRYIERNFNKIVEATKDTGILIGNLGWIEQFINAGVKVYGDYGLNAYNIQSIKAYEKLGVTMLFMSHEIVGAQGMAQAYRICYEDDRFGGRIPLMITEHPIDSEYLTDRKGIRHDVIRQGDKTIIF